MSIRYFQVQDHKHVVKTEKYTYKFEPSHRNMLTGGAYGILGLENQDQADELARVSKEFGVLELSESDAIKTLQKKSSLNINVVKHNVNLSQDRVGRVEAKSDGETSSVESFDDLMGGGEPQAKSETPEATTPEPESAPQETEATEPAPVEAAEDPAPEQEPTIETEPKPAKKRGRPKKSN
jgi:hypothetical protein